MPTDGPTVYRALRRELEVATAEAERRRAEATRLDERLRELAASRGRAIHELARLSFPEMSREAIDRGFSAAREELLALLAEKERHEAGLRGRLRQAADEVRRLEARVDELTDRLNTLVAQREGLEVAVADALKAEPEFRTRSELAAKAEADLHRDELRTEELRSEADAKLPAFRESRLFRYLLDRRYGTPDYAGRGLARRLDRWVARLIDFPRARASYDFLNRVPALVEAEVIDRRDRFEGLMGQVEALQQAKADALGLTAVLEEGRRLGAERDRSVAALDPARGSVADLDRQLADLAVPENPYYREALERLKATMARTESDTLQQMARRTPGPADDELVSRVRATERETTRLGKEAARLTEHRHVADRDLGSLLELVRRFRSANYDSARSVFSNRLDLDGFRDALRRGSLDLEGCWHSIQSSQEFLPHRLDRVGPGGPIADVMGSPEGRILAEAIGAVLEGATRGAAWRGVARRSGGDRGGRSSPPTVPSSIPVRPSRPMPTVALGRTRPGGFTSGEGF